MMFMTRFFKRKFSPTFQLKADDIVVFMVGPSGGGKSWFIKAVTESPHIKVGEYLKPSTTKVQAIRCELTDEARTALQASEKQKYIVFVDTPSFLTGTRNEEAAEQNTRLWLRESKSQSTLVGTIYVDRVADVPFRNATTIQEHLNCFARTFPTPKDSGFSPPLRLRGVLSYDYREGVIGEDRIISRREVFQQQLRTVGSSMFPARGKLKWDTSSHPEYLRRDKPEEAWNAVVELFSTAPDGSD